MRGHRITLVLAGGADGAGNLQEPDRLPLLPRDVTLVRHIERVRRWGPLAAGFLEPLKGRGLGDHTPGGIRFIHGLSRSSWAAKDKSVPSRADLPRLDKMRQVRGIEPGVLINEVHGSLLVSLINRSAFLVRTCEY